MKMTSNVGANLRAATYSNRDGDRLPHPSAVARQTGACETLMKMPSTRKCGSL
jgi:hypothetical protein